MADTRDPRGCDIILTPTEAAGVLKLSVRTLEDMRWRGGGPRYLRLSRNCVRYCRSDVIAWAEGRARFSTSYPPLS
ncbi:helix-turn-helix transcriptional regulator [Sphingopyxis sp.]|uniref:helix-turn-helix transcriptional regulator n=1 Tax=Sphingopyxis sp. TaxID=1908224 RepID=UPI003D12234F